MNKLIFKANIAIIGFLMVIPWIGGVQLTNLGAKILIYIVLIAGYNILYHTSGIISFAHGVFYALGGYSIALASKLNGNLPIAILYMLGALLLSITIAILMGFLLRRFQAIFFTMFSLVLLGGVASLFSQFSAITGGEDGINYLINYPIGKIFAYYVLFFIMAAALIILYRIITSHFGNILLAIKHNPIRAASFGYEPANFQMVGVIISAIWASLAGFMAGFWWQFVNIDTMLGLDIAMDILLISIICGRAFSGVISGCFIFLWLQYYLQNLLKYLNLLLSNSDYQYILAPIFSPNNAQLFLGVIFILIIYYSPNQSPDK